MKKYVTLLIGMVCMVLFLTACSKSGSKDITVDVDALAQELQSQAVTSDTLSSTSAQMLPPSISLMQIRWKKRPLT